MLIKVGSRLTGFLFNYSGVAFMIKLLFDIYLWRFIYFPVNSLIKKQFPK